VNAGTGQLQRSLASRHETSAVSVDGREPTVAKDPSDHEAARSSASTAPSMASSFHRRVGSWTRDTRRRGEL